MPETIFLRLLETEDKAAGLLELARQADSRAYEVDTAVFKQVPGSPMAYWVPNSLLTIEEQAMPLHARRGLGTDDDFRFIRTAWEVQGSAWPPLAKGGTFARYFVDLHLRIKWHRGGDELRAFVTARWGNAGKRIYNEEYYFRPGLTWSPRTTKDLSVRVLPEGCIIGSKGPALFDPADRLPELMSSLAVVNSSVFCAVVGLQVAAADAAARSYEAGILQNAPVPDLSPDDEALLAGLALTSWSLKRRLDTVNETSHALLLPALLSVSGASLTERAAAWAQHADALGRRLTELQAQIDDRCFVLYGINAEDRAAIERGFGGGAPLDDAPEDALEDEGPEGDDGDVRRHAAALVSWALGVAFGRFDLRLATGARPLPPEPAPFDPLPACSPGMLTGPDGLPVAAPPPGYPVAFPSDGLLVDDPGDPRDLLGAVRQVFAAVFGEAGDERLAEAVALLDPRADDLRPWLRSSFFAEHIQRYSKSRRKAPIYWRLGTPSGAYSVWVYLHRVGPDTLHAALRDHVAPKLRYEEEHLGRLTAEAGPTPSTAQRRALAAQEGFVEELRVFRDELARVAPLWSPNLDDGVVINASFLHRLFQHTRPWAKECEGHWEKLKAGEYDWSHLAMRLWPERVVPKCAEDRSLAIAHGVEDRLWVDDGGRWRPKPVTEEELTELVQARSSAAIREALREVSAAPPPARGPRAPRPAPVAAPQERPTKAPTVQLPLDLSAARPGADKPALDALRAALHQHPEGASKAELLAASGLDEGQWAAAIGALTASGEVERRGQARGMRYVGSKLRRSE